MHLVLLYLLYLSPVSGFIIPPGHSFLPNTRSVLLLSSSPPSSSSPSPSPSPPSTTSSVDLDSIGSRKKLVTEDIGAEFTDFPEEVTSSVTYTEDTDDGERLRRHAADDSFDHDEWAGFPEQDFLNNRFSYGEDKQLMKTMMLDKTPDEQLQISRSMARQDNNVWLRKETRDTWLKRKMGRQVEFLAGSQKAGEIEVDVDKIKNVFKIMGSVIELLSVTKDGCYRFKYHGLLKHKHGMECWCKQLLEESGVTVSGVRFEPGPREYDQEDVGSNVS